MMAQPAAASATLAVDAGTRGAGQHDEHLWTKAVRESVIGMSRVTRPLAQALDS
jgi:hypothetical protein